MMGCCGICNREFELTNGQQVGAITAGRKVYCSDECRKENKARRLRAYYEKNYIPVRNRKSLKRQDGIAIHACQSFKCPPGHFTSF